MENINKRFKDLRKACEKTQTEMGKILGITTSGISDIEAERRKVTEQHLIMLSNWNEQKVNIDWLRTGKGKMFKDISLEEKTYSRFGLIMEKGSPIKKNIITMLTSMVETLPDEQWDYIYEEFKLCIDRIEKGKKKSDNEEE